MASNLARGLNRTVFGIPIGSALIALPWLVSIMMVGYLGLSNDPNWGIFVAVSFGLQVPTLVVIGWLERRRGSKGVEK